MRKDINDQREEDCHSSTCYAKIDFAYKGILKIGDKVVTKDGTTHTIAKINRMREAESIDPFYRWDCHSLEIEHAAMDYKDGRNEIEKENPA